MRDNAILMSASIGTLSLDGIINHRFKVQEAEKSIQTVKAWKGIKIAIAGRQPRHPYFFMSSPNPFLWCHWCPVTVKFGSKIGLDTCNHVSCETHRLVRSAYVVQAP